MKIFSGNVIYTCTVNKCLNWSPRCSRQRTREMVYGYYGNLEMNCLISLAKL